MVGYAPLSKREGNGEYICGHCMYHVHQEDGWYCANENSENYGLETAYDEGEECYDCVKRGEG